MEFFPYYPAYDTSLIKQHKDTMMIFVCNGSNIKAHFGDYKLISITATSQRITIVQ